MVAGATRTSIICNVRGPAQGFLWRWLRKAPNTSLISLYYSPQSAFQNSSDTICFSLSTEEVEWKLYPKYGFFLPGAWKMSHFSQPTKSVYLYWKPLGQNQIFINWKKLNEKKRVTNKTIPGYARFLLLLSQ